MKLLVTIAVVFFVLKSNSQECKKNALMVKGNQLEYRTYSLKENTNNEYNEGTRKVYTVDSVAENAAITTSYITIISRAVNCDYAYSKTIEMKCNGKDLMYNFGDLSGADTVYTCDMMPSQTKNFRFWSASKYIPLGSSGSEVNLPLEMKKGQKIPAGQKFELATVQLIREMSPNIKATSLNPYSYSGKFVESKMNGKATIENITVGDKSKVTTPAGTFDCYEIITSCTYEMSGMKYAQTGKSYYSPEIGIIKVESMVGKIRVYYYELNSIKKAN